MPRFILVAVNFVTTYVSVQFVVPIICHASNLPIKSPDRELLV